MRPARRGKSSRKFYSCKLTWTCRGALNKTTILYIGPSVSFHVNLGEGISPAFDQRSSQKQVLQGPARVGMSTWLFPEIWGIFGGCPHNKSPSIWGLYWGPLIWETHISSDCSWSTLAKRLTQACKMHRFLEAAPAAPVVLLLVPSP